MVCCVKSDKILFLCLEERYLKTYFLLYWNFHWTWAVQFSTMNMDQLLKNSMKMGSLWESKTCLKDAASLFNC